MTLLTDLEEVIDDARVDADIMRAIVQGPAEGPLSTVDTENGEVKTFARTLAEADVFADEAEDAADRAEAAADNAAISALSFELLSELTAVTGASEGASATVWGDTAANNGVYAWDDTGDVWVRKADLPTSLVSPHPANRIYVLDSDGFASFEFDLEGTGSTPTRADSGRALSGKASYYTTEAEGDPLVLPALRPLALATFGPAVTVTNEEKSIGPLTPTYCATDRVFIIRWDHTRTAVGGTAETNFDDNPIEYEIVWMDADYAELSRTSLELVKDMNVGDRTRRIDIVATFDLGANAITVPTDAIWFRPLLTFTGTNHTDSVIGIDVTQVDLGQAPKRFDGHPEITLAAGTEVVLSGYYGPALILEREEDEAQETFHFQSDGSLPIAAMRAFAGNQSARIHRLYCQRTRRRFGVADDPFKPYINYDGPIPIIEGRTNAALNFGGNTSSSSGITRNQEKLSVIAHYLNHRERDTSQKGAYYAHAGGGYKRIGIWMNGREEPDGIAMTLTVASARLDTGSHEIAVNDGEPIYLYSTAYRTTAVSADHSDAKRYVRDVVDGEPLRMFEDDSARGTGLTADTPSQATRMGEHNGAYTAVAIKQGLMTDAEVAEIHRRAPDMKRIVYGKTFSIFPANNSWFSWEYGFVRPDGMILMGTADGAGRQFICVIPQARNHPEGYRVMVSSYWHDGGSTGDLHASDHISPLPRLLADGRLFVALPGQQWEDAVPYKVGRNDDPRRLVDEPVRNLPFLTGTSYTQLFLYGAKLFFLAKSGDEPTFWSMRRVANTNGSNLEPADFSALVSMVTHSDNFYLNASELLDEDRVSTGVVRWCCNQRPGIVENHFYLLQLDMATGSVSSGPTALGNIDGSTEGGNTLPAVLTSDLAKIYTVPTDMSTRVFNMSKDGTGINFVEFDPADENEPGTYYHLRLTDPDNPHLEASWDKIQIGPTGGAGETIDWDNKRWPGTGSNTRPGAATLSVEAGIVDDPLGFYRFIRFDSEIGDGSDFVETLLMTRRVPLMRPYVPRDAKENTPTMLLEAVTIDDVTNSLNRIHMVYPLGDPT